MTIEDVLREQIETQGELHGTEQIALSMNVRSKNWLRRLLRRLEGEGVLTILSTKGGRGNKTIYKRNRNSPGAPRKTR